jgi:hypothetical protein
VGEKQNQSFSLSFNPPLKVDFQGSRVTSGSGLLSMRELDKRLGLSAFLTENVVEGQPAKNTRVPDQARHHEMPVTVSAKKSWFHSLPFWLVLGAFALRLILLFGLHTYRWNRADDDCLTGENGNIAISIASGRGFSSPFTADYTGPSAWIAPAYPYFCALVFHFFGVASRNSYIFIFMVQSLLSALTVLPILGIARRTVGREAGWWAAALWAFFPWFSKWSVTWVWEVSLSALLVALLFWYVLWLDEDRSPRAWAGMGALGGIMLLVNPSLTSVLLVAMAWCGSRSRLSGKRWMRKVALSLTVCVLAISPWLVRNRVVMGQWVFLRDNFGFEFALGNYHASFGRGWYGFHPAGNPAELARYKQLGEIEYVRQAEQAAVQFATRHPGELLTLTAKRIWYFWDGSAMGYRAPIPWYWLPQSFAIFSFLLLPALLWSYRRHVHGWWLFAGAIIFYPLPYYLTYSQVRYRHAIEPLMVLLMGYLANSVCGVLSQKGLSAFKMARRESLEIH